MFEGIMIIIFEINLAFLAALKVEEFANFLTRAGLNHTPVTGAYSESSYFTTIRFGPSCSRKLTSTERKRRPRRKAAGPKK
jgi:hypothetical protein